MKKRRIIAGTVIAAAALCWALWGDTAKVDAVPAAAAENDVSAPCAPQMEPVMTSSNIDVPEPATEPKTVPVAGSSDSPVQKLPQATPSPTPESQPIEASVTEPPTVVPEPAPTEKPSTKSPTGETPQLQGGMIYVPGFGYLKSEGSSEWSVSEDMYENGNKVGFMG